MFDLERTKTWETKKAIDKVAAQNLEFTQSMKSGLLFRPKENFFLIYSDFYLDLMDEHGFDWGNFFVEDFERIVGSTGELDKLSPRQEQYKQYANNSKLQFFLLSPHCPTLWQQRTAFDFTIEEGKIEGYRFVEALCGEMHVFVCYGTTRLSLIEDELTFKDKKYTKQGTLDSLSKEVFSTKSKD